MKVKRKLLFSWCKYSSKPYGFEDNDKSVKTLSLSTCVKNLTNFKEKSPLIFHPSSASPIASSKGTGCTAYASLYPSKAISIKNYQQ